MYISQVPLWLLVSDLFCSWLVYFILREKYRYFGCSCLRERYR
jgi:hypothetical protein